MRNNEKLSLTQTRQWFDPEFVVRTNECDFLGQPMGWWISLIPEKIGFCSQRGWLECRGRSILQGYFVKIWCTLEELLSWFLVDSLPNACKLRQTHTKDFLTLEKCMSVFRVCAVWILLRLYCPEVTFGLSWGQCFLFVSDLSGKKYMKNQTEICCLLMG